MCFVGMDFGDTRASLLPHIIQELHNDHDWTQDLHQIIITKAVLLAQTTCDPAVQTPSQRSLHVIMLCTMDEDEVSQRWVRLHSLIEWIHIQPSRVDPARLIVV